MRKGERPKTQIRRRMRYAPQTELDRVDDLMDNNLTEIMFLAAKCESDREIAPVGHS